MVPIVSPFSYIWITVTMMSSMFPRRLNAHCFLIVKDVNVNSIEVTLITSFWLHLKEIFYETTLFPVIILRELVFISQFKSRIIYKRCSSLR